MKLLTGNALVSGRVLWWTGTGWSESIADAAPVADADAAALLRQAAEQGVINDAALIEAEPGGAGFRPLRMRERVRAFGPTVGSCATPIGESLDVSL
jgi:hypothetical protein